MRRKQIHIKLHIRLISLKELKVMPPEESRQSNVQLRVCLSITIIVSEARTTISINKEPLTKLIPEHILVPFPKAVMYAVNGLTPSGPLGFPSHRSGLNTPDSGYRVSLLCMWKWSMPTGMPGGISYSP